jgi:predicted nucleotidyltransferase
MDSMGRASLLTREQILAAFAKLADELAARGVSAELVIVGGAAMSLEHRVRASTRDVDVLVIGGAEKDTLELSAKVASSLGLEGDWLNQDVRRIYTNTAVSDGVTVFDAPGLSVRTVSTMQLLAMKLCAFRDDVDVDDARHLLSEVSPRIDLESLWVALEPFLIRGKQRSARDNFEDLWEQTRGPI